MAKESKISTEETKSIAWQIVKTIGGLLLALIIIRFYIFQPFTIDGSSMEPSFYDKEYVIVDELSYVVGHPDRGDVVVFRHPEPACNEHVASNYFNRVFVQGPCANYIKRVIGLPGETVTIKDGKVSIKNEENPSGMTLKEDYVLGNIPTLGNQTTSLSDDEYFVLGDNRGPNASSDSREWGPLTEDHIIGKALVVLFPTEDFGFVKSPEYEIEN
ncbi:MAG: signal peptidase I [Patescibacteria group bacterium]|nr:signal peptidase I [Patescibacteria group bacterium]